MFTEQCLCYGSILFLKIGFLIFLQGGMAQWFCRYLPPKRTNLISPDTRFVGLSLLLNCAFSLKTCILYGGEKYVMRKTWETILHWQRSTMNNQRNHRLDEKSSWIIKITKKIRIWLSLKLIGSTWLICAYNYHNDHSLSIVPLMPWAGQRDLRETEGAWPSDIHADLFL